MKNNQLWIMVVGGDSDDERMLCKGDMSLVKENILRYDDEVNHDCDKYFELITPFKSYCFSSYSIFCDYVLC